jgi:hypothetical protein
MSNSLSTMSILALSVMGMFAPTVKADEWDKTTTSQSIRRSKWKALSCRLVRMS